MLVIGAGARGSTLRSGLREGFRREQILVVDEAPHPGGSLRRFGSARFPLSIRPCSSS